LFDGRLDNYRELIKQLYMPDSEAADSLVVLAAFQRWGSQFFARFIGDWALALWSHLDGSLYLARDHVGTRSLYFEQTKECVSCWSTYLETLFAESKTSALKQRVRSVLPHRALAAPL
jgi:asparagine synthase (glutamine-hydrolysing)